MIFLKFTFSWYPLWSIKFFTIIRLYLFASQLLVDHVICVHLFNEVWEIDLGLQIVKFSSNGHSLRTSGKTLVSSRLPIFVALFCLPLRRESFAWRTGEDQEQRRDSPPQSTSLMILQSNNLTRFPPTQLSVWTVSPIPANRRVVVIRVILLGHK